MRKAVPLHGGAASCYPRSHGTVIDTCGPRARSKAGAPGTRLPAPLIRRAKRGRNFGTAGGCAMAPLAAFNLKSWIDEHRHLLKPPVGNVLVFKDSNFQVMIVGGPNRRNDYHIDAGEELFYQIEGDIVLKVIEDGKRRDIPIREGDMLLLPPFVPHSPQRPAGTVGMVVERERLPEEEDRFRWYCEG